MFSASIFVTMVEKQCQEEIHFSVQQLEEFRTSEIIFSLTPKKLITPDFSFQSLKDIIKGPIFEEYFTIKVAQPCPK